MNPSVTDGFTSQRASNGESVLMSRHHVPLWYYRDSTTTPCSSDSKITMRARWSSSVVRSVSTRCHVTSRSSSKTRRRSWRRCDEVGRCRSSWLSMKFSLKGLNRSWLVQMLMQCLFWCERRLGHSLCWARKTSCTLDIEKNWKTLKNWQIFRWSFDPVNLCIR